MISKKILGMGIVLSLVSSGAMAWGTLTLVSQGEPSTVTQITVECGQSRSTEHNTGMPIPANGQKKISYFLVKLLGSPLYCDFYEANGSVLGNDLGWAQFTVSPGANRALVNSLTVLQSGYTVSLQSAHLNPLPLNTYAANMTVTLADNN